MAYNRDEEIEHACMALEWLRRNMTEWDEAMRTFLFSSGDITELEEESQFEGAAPQSGRSDSDLGIGGKR